MNQLHTSIASSKPHCERVAILFTIVLRVINRSTYPAIAPPNEVETSPGAQRNSVFAFAASGREKGQATIGRHRPGSIAVTCMLPDTCLTATRERRAGDTRKGAFGSFPLV
jgi:hypothetical protein